MLSCNLSCNPRPCPLHQVTTDAKDRAFVPLKALFFVALLRVQPPLVSEGFGYAFPPRTTERHLSLPEISDASACGSVARPESNRIF